MRKRDSSAARSLANDLAPEKAETFLATLFGEDRQLVTDQHFKQFIALLEQYERAKIAQHQEMVATLYRGWASKFELLKAEFNSVWDLFSSIEQQLTGWYAVSPNLSPWKTVACSKDGYTFAACIMKNHHRDAPLSEKSLSVSFGLYGSVTGIGDERWVGGPDNPSDRLQGLPVATSMTRREQAKGAVKLLERISKCSLLFRLNHHKIGQQSALYPLSMLDRYSLQGLCRGLFIALNNDVLTDLKLALSSPKQLLLTGDIADYS